jgi:hypothetical protein
MSVEREEDLTTPLMETYQRSLQSRSKVTGIPREFKIVSEESGFEAQSLLGSRQPEQQDTPQKQTLAPPPPGITSVTPNVVSFAGGTTITITGSNFVSGATVNIGGSPAANVAFVNASTITCVTPTHSIGNVPVEVTNPSGQKVTKNNAILYVDQPDNIYLEGPTTVSANDYFLYKATIRLGTEVFILAPGASVDVAFAYGRPYADGFRYSTLGYSNYTGYAMYTPQTQYGIYSLHFTKQSGTYSDGSTRVGGPTQECKIRQSLDQPGPGYVDFGVHLGDVFVHTPLLPIYGEASQPRAFRIDISATPVAPPPAPPPSSSDTIGWSMGSAYASGAGGRVSFGPWNWEGFSLTSRQADLAMLLPSGAVDTSFNGAAAITHTFITQPTSSNRFGVSHPASVTFSGGRATVNISANYAGDNPSSQSYAYFTIHATAGSVSASTPTCSILNHL